MSCESNKTDECGRLEKQDMVEEEEDEDDYMSDKILNQMQV